MYFNSVRIASGHVLAAVQDRWTRYRTTGHPEDAQAVADAFAHCSSLWELYRQDCPLARTYRRAAEHYRAAA